MAFEIRISVPGPVHEESPPVARFRDDEWWNLLSLAHVCGFDPSREHVHIVYPADGEAHQLDDRLASGLYIGVRAALSQDTLPFATIWDSDDGRLHFRWTDTPGYGRRRQPDDSRNSGVKPDFDLDEANLRRLLKCLREDRVLVAWTEDPEADRSLLKTVFH